MEVGMKLNLDARFETVTTKPYTVSWQTAIGYALGIGATADDLDLLWEGHSNFRVFPTFAVVPTFAAVMKLLSGLNVDLNRVVHGGQDVHMRQPIPLNVPMISTGKITEILDKVKGAVVNIETETSTEAHGVLFTTSWSIFCRGQGDFGGERGTAPVLPEPLSDAPQLWSGTAHTNAEQALLYRLSGDTNPLHVDPELAKKVGFTSPILHGLCTYGQAARLTMKSMYDGQWDRLSRFSARFSREVYPGDSVQITVVPTSDAHCHRLQATVGERTVLSHGVMEVESI
jgi:acyl dehydratase